MPTRNINLTPQMDKFVSKMIKKGNYANASEVMRAGLRALEQDEQENQAKILALRAALQAGEESGIAEDGVFDRLDQYIDRLAARKVNVA